MESLEEKNKGKGSIMLISGIEKYGKLWKRRGLKMGQIVGNWKKCWELEKD